MASRAASSEQNPAYLGRFAPSPTGPLHFGSLVAAVASYLDARAARGAWLVRMEDLDPPREKPGAADDILRTLDAFGFEWDGAVLFQSSRTEAYAEAVADLVRVKAAYPCSCSRREVAMTAASGIDGPVYPGTCRQAPRHASTSPAIRVLTHDISTGFVDRIQGACEQRLARDVGDFVVRRADGLFAYQIAVVLDDALQGITQIVRGADLLASTPRQIHLQRLLGLPAPEYAHVPVVRDESGQKLSKSDAAHPVDPAQPIRALADALEFLGQPVPSTGHLREFWAEAAENWDIGRGPPHR